MAARRRLLRFLPLAGALVLALVVAGLVWLIHGFMAQKATRPQRLIQEVTLIRPPPPPPPPPDKPPPPPPPKTEQPIQQKLPQPTPNNAPPPPQQLGLDATGSAGSDSFGLVARQGGANLVGSGGALFAWYTGKLRDQVLSRLTADAKLRSSHYSVAVQVWIAADGRIDRTRIVDGTGDPSLDRLIEAALAALGRLDQPPPLEMPQPINLKIVSHG